MMTKEAALKQNGFSGITNALNPRKNTREYKQEKTNL